MTGAGGIQSTDRLEDVTLFMFDHETERVAQPKPDQPGGRGRHLDPDQISPLGSQQKAIDLPLLFQEGSDHAGPDIRILGCEHRGILEFPLHLRP